MPLPKHRRRMRPLLLVAFAALLASPATAESLTGKIERVDNDGRAISIGGTAIAISGARSNICIRGICDRPRTDLKAGMECVVETAARDGKPEARKISCK